MITGADITAKHWRAALIIIAVACAAYFNTLFNGFVYDDTAQVVENPWIRDIRHLPEIFSTHVAGFERGEASNYYRPLMHVFYLLTYALFGPAPWGFHLVNILFHAGVSLLVFFVASRIFGRAHTAYENPFLSPPFFAALLFAVHPAHAEAVAWIAAIPDLSAAFFFLLALFLHTGPRIGGLRPSILSAGALFLAALCKETALMLPLVMIAYDAIYHEGPFRPGDYARRYVPALAAVGLYMALRYLGLGSFLPLQGGGTFGLSEQFLNMIPVFVKYLGKLLLPVNLNAYYVLHPVASIVDPKFILSIIVVAALLLAAGFALRKNRNVFFSMVLMIVPLAPGVYAAISNNNFAERHLYLPSVGFVMLLSFLITAVARQQTARAAVLIVVGAVACTYSLATIQRNTVWKDNVTLWSDTVRKSPDGAVPHTQLADALFTEERRADKAIEQYQAALRLQPGMITARNNLGLAYAAIGRPDLAVEQYHVILRLKPDSVETLNNLGLAYKNLGLIDQAVAHYQAALRLMPDHPGLHYNIAVCYVMIGAQDKAAEHFRRAQGFSVQ